MTKSSAYDQVMSHSAGEHLRVLGLPATGKTHALVARYNAIKKRRPTDNVFVLTYSRSALKQLTEMILPAGAASSGPAPVITYYALAREIIAVAGQRTPHVLESLDEALLLHRIIRDGTPRLQSDLRNIRESERFQRELLNVFHVLLQNGIKEDSLDRVEREATGAGIRDVVALYRRFLSLLSARRSAATYYDISWIAANLCSELPSTHPFRSACTWLIDDFQDIDAGQYQLIKSLLPPDGETGVSVFGDPLGAYFGFRGTSGGFLMDAYRKDYGGQTISLPPVSYGAVDARATFAEITNEILGEAGTTFYPPTTKAPTAGDWGPLFDNAASQPESTTASDRLRNVDLRVAEDEVDEVYNVGGQIRSLIAQKKYRADEIAVIANDKALYEPILRHAFAQWGIVLASGRPNHSSFRQFVYVLLQLSRSRRDVSLLEAFTTSPFFRYLRTSVDKDFVQGLVDDGREWSRIYTKRLSKQLDDAPASRWMALIGAHLLGVCRAYVDDTNDESILDVVSALIKRWDDYVDASLATALVPSLAVFLRTSQLFGRQSTMPAPMVDEVALFSCREVRGYYAPVVFVVGCSELIFPSAIRRESLMPTAALQTLFDQALPDRDIRLYHTRSAEDHLHNEYHLLYHAMTRARCELHLSAPKSFAGQPRPAPARILDTCVGVSPNRVDAPVRAVPPAIRFSAAWVREETPAKADNLLQSTTPIGALWHATNTPAQPFTVDRFPLSKSALEAYLKCPRRFFYLKVLRIKEEESGALLVGKIFHDVMAAIGTAYPTKAGVQRDMSDAFLDKTISETIEHERGVEGGTFFDKTMRFYLRAMVRTALDLDARESDDYAVEAVEAKQEFEYRGWTFTTRIDRLERMANEGTTILDYKTGKFNKTAKNLRDKTLVALQKPSVANWQVPIYTRGYQELAGQTPDSFKHLVQAPGDAPFFVTLYVRQNMQDLPPVATSNKRDYQGYSYLLAEEVEQIMDEAVMHAENMFSARPVFERTEDRFHCRICAFNRLCDRRAD